MHLFYLCTGHDILTIHINSQNHDELVSRLKFIKKWGVEIFHQTILTTASTDSYRT
jgi:hypothetical protein